MPEGARQPIDANRVSELVRRQLSTVADDDIRAELNALLQEPRREIREWEYSADPLSYPCWRLTPTLGCTTVLVYCEHGFGAELEGLAGHPWGNVSATEMTLGMDAEWHTSLERAYRMSRSAGGFRGALEGAALALGSGYSPGTPESVDEGPEYRLYGVLSTQLTRAQVAGLFVSIGWASRKSSWYEFEVASRWCELEITAESPILLAGGGVDLPDHSAEIVALLRRAGLSFQLEIYDIDQRLVWEHSE